MTRRDVCGLGMLCCRHGIMVIVPDCPKCGKPAHKVHTSGAYAHTTEWGCDCGWECAGVLSSQVTHPTADQFKLIDYGFKAAMHLTATRREAEPQSTVPTRPRPPNDK